jgi:hypothetical protein
MAASAERTAGTEMIWAGVVPDTPPGDAPNGNATNQHGAAASRVPQVLGDVCDAQFLKQVDRLRCTTVRDAHI